MSDGKSDSEQPYGDLLHPVRTLRTGQDPDPRFTLANERTFLAWNRTALALIAAALALEGFGEGIVSATPRAILVVGSLVAAGLLALSALVRWVRVEAALRMRRSLPLPGVAPAVSAGFAAVAIVLVFAVDL